MSNYKQKNIKRAGSRRIRRKRPLINTSTNLLCNGPIENEFRRITPGVLRIPRNVFVSPAVIVDLMYVDLRVDNNAGSTYTSYRMRMNSAYDPDPALGSGALPGFTEWAGFFRNYRVLKFEIECEVTNLESNSLSIIICPSQADLGLNYSTMTNLMANPYAVSHQLSPKGGLDKATMRCVIDLGKYYGNTAQWLGNDAFGATISTNPTTLFYMNVGAVCSANLVSGFSSRLICRYTTAFSGRGVLNA